MLLIGLLDGVFEELEKLPELAPLLGCIVLFCISLGGAFVELEKLPELAPLLGCVVVLCELFEGAFVGLEKLPDLAPLLGVVCDGVEVLLEGVEILFEGLGALPPPLAKAVTSKVVKVKVTTIKRVSIIAGKFLNLFFK